MKKILHSLAVIAVTMAYVLVAIPLVLVDFLMSIVSRSWGFMPVVTQLFILMNEPFEEDL